MLPVIRSHRDSVLAKVGTISDVSVEPAEHARSGWLRWHKRKAAQARDTAAKMSGRDAKSAMLELAERYEKLARRPRIIATMLAVPEDSPSEAKPSSAFNVSANFGARDVECLRLERNGALGREPGLPQ
jgi:hypothetical protein